MVTGGAYSQAHKALAQLWTDRCAVWGKESFLNPETGRETFRDKLLWDNIPCRISYTGVFPVMSSRGSASQRIKSSLLSVGASSTRGQVKLFAGPDVDIPPGSRVIVTREGKETAYHQSGIPAVYASHVEVPLEAEQKWA